jgi:CHAT domain-containing protein
MLTGPRAQRRLPLETIRPCNRRTRIRQNIPGRTASRSQLLPLDHAPAGVGVSRTRRDQQWRYKNEWQLLSISWLVVLILPALLCSCNPKSKPDPQEDYQQARLTIVKGDLVQAEHQAKEGYDHYSQQGIEWAWKFRILEAEILAYRKLNQEALATLNFPLPADLSSGDEAIRKHMVEALALARLGRDQEANVHLQEADQLCQLNCSSVDGQLAQIHGVVELGRGNFTEADVFFRQSLRSARRQQDQLLEATTLLNLGLTALKQEHYDNSILWSTDGYKAARALGAHFAEQKALGNLGWAYYRMGDADKSAFFFQQAADEARNLDAKNDLVKWVRALGLVSQEMNQTAIAEDYYKQSLALARQSEDKGDLVDAMTALAAISVEQQKWDQAIRYSQEAIGLCRSRGDRAGELDALLVEGKIAAHQNDATRASQMFREVAADQQSEVPLKWEAQENLARLYEDEHHPSEAARQYKLSLATFESARSSLHQEELRLPFLSNAAHLQDDYIHFLVTQGATAEALQVADYSRAQTLAEGLGVPINRRRFRPVSGDAQNTASRAGATILFYWLGPRYSYLWVVTPRRTKLVSLPPALGVDALVRNYRRELEGPRDLLEAGSRNGRELYNILVAPARQEIAESPRTVIIPDGTLNNLNFETLLIPEPELHYMIDDVTLVNASSLRLLRASGREATRARPKLLLIGDPVTPNHEYGDLPNAAIEMERVEKHFEPPDRKVYARAEATNQAYLSSNPGQFAYIHFVAHAAASRFSPLDSAIILSKATSEDDSFKLYARDIVRRPVQADLVTISTCYGAGTRAYTGEGLVGLSWAFMRAGAHNVIGAVWEVSDSSTPELMDYLYGELAEGRDPDVALRAAKLSLLHSNSIFRKPFYWAPFQLYVSRWRSRKPSSPVPREDVPKRSQLHYHA